MRTFEIIDLVACADIDTDLAQARAEEFEVAGGCSVDELLADAGIEIVVNLTVPKVHASVNRQILEAGKHAHTEKPFAVDKAEDGQVALDHCQRQMPDVILLDWKHAGHERHRFSAGAAPVGLRRPAGGRAMHHGERYPADSLGD